MTNPSEFPYRPLSFSTKKPYIAPHKEFPLGVKAVTIAAGFRCKSGVVLCADSELTIPGWLKFSGSKIRMYRKLKCQPAFTLAGDERFCAMLIDNLVSCISDAEREGKDIAGAIEGECLRVHRAFTGEQYEKESAIIFSVLVGPDEKKRRILLSTSEGVVHQVAYDCQGTGRSAAQAMLEELFSQNLSLKQTALVAAYMLAEAKTYGYGCGKDSHILLLEDNGGWTPFPDDPFYPSLREIEEDYIRLKRLLRPILFAYSDLSVDEGRFSEILANFGQCTRKQRAKRREAYDELVELQIQAQIEDADEVQESESDEQKSG